MFTSRAEFRILLRQDNADIRLTERSHRIGLAADERMQRVEQKLKGSSEVTAFLKRESTDPEAANAILVPRGTSPLKQKVKLHDILLRPQITFNDILSIAPDMERIAEAYGDLKEEVIEQVEINAKYDGYLDKEREMAEKMTRLEEVALLEDMEYHRLPSLSIEARQKLEKVRPRTLGQASRISGVSPADLSVLLVYLGR